MPPVRTHPSSPGASNSTPYSRAVPFDPKKENLDNLDPVEDATYREKAEHDPYTFYRFRTGTDFHDLTIPQLLARKRAGLIQWMLNKHYNKLDDDHIVRRALDTYCEKYPKAEKPPRNWSPPDPKTAPARFKTAPGQLIPIEVFDIIGLFHVSAKTLQTAGLRFSEKNRNGRNKLNKYWLYQVYEYAKFANTPKGGTTADSALDEYLDKFDRCFGGSTYGWRYCECDNCERIRSGGDTREGQQFWLDCMKEDLASRR